MATGEAIPDLIKNFALGNSMYYCCTVGAHSGSFTDLILLLALAFMERRLTGKFNYQVLRYSTKAQNQLGLHFVPFPGLSSSGDQVFGEHSRCNLSPPLPLLLGFLGVQLAHLLRQMMTVQNPKTEMEVAFESL